MCKSCLDVICSSVEIKKHCSFPFCSFAYALKLYIPVYHTEIGIGNTDARLQPLSCPSPSRSDPWKIVGIFLTVWNALEKKNPLSPLRSFGFSFVYDDSACEELKKEGSMPHQELVCLSPVVTPWHSRLYHRHPEAPRSWWAVLVPLSWLT